MATTTNYSWTTPDDTDLVKDGAAAIRTLGSSADTTVKNLNPGTTAGDIDYYTSSTAKARVAIGTAGQFLAVNSGATAPVWVAPPSGGKVLQVVSATTTTPMTTTGTTLTDTNLTATITPSAATSKILVLTQQYIATSRSSAYFGTVEGALLRGATKIVDYSTGAGTNLIFFEVQSATSGALVLVQNYSYLDSPATTSATTYKTQLCIDAATASASVTAQQNNNMSSIILMEIGA